MDEMPEPLDTLGIDVVQAHQFRVIADPVQQTVGELQSPVTGSGDHHSSLHFASFR